MVNSKVVGIDFDVERYIQINDFKYFNNNFLMAAAIALIEGNIQINKNDNLITLLGMYNIKRKNTDYIFLSIYNLIKTNSEIYKFAVKYFNLWHSGEIEEFTYDSYHKSELINNFNYLISLIYDELNSAIKNNDLETIKTYEKFLEDLAESMG